MSDKGKGNSEEGIGGSSLRSGQANDAVNLRMHAFQRARKKFLMLTALKNDKAIKKVPWCSGQAYWPLEPVTEVRILPGLLKTFLLGLLEILASYTTQL